MGYFQLAGPVNVKSYPFDFHSHFNGILPLESDLKWTKNELNIKVNVGGMEKEIKIEKNDGLSILGLLGKKTKDEKSTREAHYEAFQMLLKHIGKENPFRIFDMNNYQRGECAAENIYIACCLLQHLHGNRVDYDIRDPDIYQITGRLLENGSLKSDAAYHVIAYFNKKLFAANKYTPFDDAYWARSAITDDKGCADKFNLMSLCYMHESGVRYAQIALSKKSVEKINNLIGEFEKTYEDTGYKLLVQSPNIYSDKVSFGKELESILELFKIEGEGPKFERLVGIDLLAPEVKTGLYVDFFEFLENNKSTFNSYVNTNGNPCKKAIMHIHCGEGGGNSENNRSLFGFYLCNSFHPDIRKFSSALADYAVKCYQKNAARKGERERERKNLGKTIRAYSEVTTLFDELFQWNNLVVDNLQLHRFDINSPVSRALVAYNGKTNIMHLCDALDKKPIKEPINGQSYYELLCKDNATFSFRIGHAYYNRNYLSARFPVLYYDTNLGSNFITGAAGIFDSTQMYKVNRGLRHLDGYIDTNLIEEVLDSVAYMGDDMLDVAQIKNLDDFISKGNAPTISFPGNKDIKDAVDTFIKYHHGIINVPEFPREIKYRLMYSILSIALNWRSFLLGADGQGVEHSDTTIEFVRMVFMLAYRLSDERKNMEADWLNSFSHLIWDVSLGYWNETIGDANLPGDSKNVYKINRFQGFKARNSVVLVEALGIDQPASL
jgi:hypothetical protein